MENNNNKKVNLTQFAKGSWQYQVARDLENCPSGITNPISYLKGAARSYSGKYEQSFRSLLRRIENAGYKIERTPGVRGGEWSATYKLIVPAELKIAA